MTTDYCLYRLFDSSGVLLYVGATHNLALRISQHRSNQPWWMDVDESRTTPEWYDTPKAVADAEVKAITTEAPIWNRAGRTWAMTRYNHAPRVATKHEPRRPATMTLNDFRRDDSDIGRRLRAGDRGHPST